jgi:TonB family protein
MQTDPAGYYAKRAGEDERLYAKPERQADLARLVPAGRMGGLIGGILVLLLSACASRPFHGGGYSPGEPVVTIASVTQPEGSPGRGYPLVLFPLPHYPLDFVRAGLEGEVTVRFTVDPLGKVQEVVILRADFPELAAAVLAVAQKWRFREMPDRDAPAPQELIFDCRVKFSME